MLLLVDIHGDHELLRSRSGGGDRDDLRLGRHLRLRERRRLLVKLLVRLRQRMVSDLKDGRRSNEINWWDLAKADGSALHTNEIGVQSGWLDHRAWKMRYFLRFWQKISSSAECHICSDSAKSSRKMPVLCKSDLKQNRYLRPLKRMIRRDGHIWHGLFLSHADILHVARHRSWPVVNLDWLSIIRSYWGHQHLRLLRLFFVRVVNHAPATSENGNWRLDLHHLESIFGTVQRIIHGISVPAKKDDLKKSICAFPMNFVSLCQISWVSCTKKLLAADS